MSDPTERALLVGILVDAIEAVLHDGEGKVAVRRAHDARLWMAARDPGWPFSFEGVCRVLRVDADALRVALSPTEERRGPDAPAGEAAPRPRPRLHPPIR